MQESSSAQRPKAVAPCQPRLSLAEAQAIFQSIDCRDVSGLRDRALVALVFHNHLRPEEALRMKIGDFLRRGGRYFLRLSGSNRTNPRSHFFALCFSEAELALASYLESSPASDLNGPLFRALDPETGALSAKRLSARDAQFAINQRASSLGFTREISLHEFRMAGVGLIRKQAFTYDL
jgi:integrase